MATFNITCSDPGHAGRQGQPGWAAVLGTSDRPTTSPVLCTACAAAAAAVAATQATNQNTIQQTAAGAIANLELADANWGALTALQKDAATRLAVRVCAKLARLALSQFDGS